MSFFSLRIHQNRFAPDPIGGAYSAPRLRSWFQGGRFAAGGEWREGLGRGGRERGNGEGRGKGEVGGMAAWLLGDRRPCCYI